MKIIINKNGGEYSVYVPKKDLEAPVIEYEMEGAFGGTFTLSNGWKLYIPPMSEEPVLPKTVDAKVISKE